jgi:hypothetical protein
MNTFDRKDSLGGIFGLCIVCVGAALILLLATPAEPTLSPSREAFPSPIIEKQPDIGKSMRAEASRPMVIVHGSQAQYAAAIPLFPKAIVAWEKVECLNGRCPPARYTVERDGSSWEFTSLQSAVNHLRASP